MRNTLLDAGGEYGERYAVDAIKGGDPVTNAGLLLSVLKGEEHGAYRAAAVENAAAAIMVGDKAATYAEALALARESIDSGRALAKMNAMMEAMR